MPPSPLPLFFTQILKPFLYRSTQHNDIFKLSKIIELAKDKQAQISLKVNIIQVTIYCMLAHELYLNCAIFSVSFHENLQLIERLLLLPKSLTNSQLKK